MKQFLFTFLAVAGLTKTAVSQHEGHTMPVKDTSTRMVKDTTSKQQPITHLTMLSNGMHNMIKMPNVSHAFSRNLPINRNGSGTGWLPDASPMYGIMYHSKKFVCHHLAKFIYSYYYHSLLTKFHQTKTYNYE